VGRHSGVHNFTIGQRKGLGFATGKPQYVIAIDREKNRVVVGDDETLRTTACDVRDVNWIAHEFSAQPLRATVKIRHKHVPAEATITPLDALNTRIVFDAPQRAITAGQGAVFYDGERVLGGGWIR
jgi:tRNA-specific 2-thiouridylase